MYDSFFVLAKNCAKVRIFGDTGKAFRLLFQLYGCAALPEKWRVATERGKEAGVLQKRCSAFTKKMQDFLQLALHLFARTAGGGALPRSGERRLAAAPGREAAQRYASRNFTFPCGSMCIDCAVAGKSKVSPAQNSCSVRLPAAGAASRHKTRRRLLPSVQSRMTNESRSE